MAKSDYPGFQIRTPYGDLWLQIKGNDEIYVYPFYTEGKDNPLVINRVPYNVYGSLWVLPDGSLDRCRTNAGGQPEYIDGWSIRRDKGPWNERDNVSDAARKAFYEQVVPCVEKFLADNPHVLQEGELARREIILADRRSQIREAEALIASLRDEEETLSLQIDELTREGRLITQDGERCRRCFSPLRRVHESNGKYFRYHCKKCGNDAKALPNE